jgi:hypothetical protein
MTMLRPLLVVAVLGLAACGGASEEAAPATTVAGPSAQQVALDQQQNQAICDTDLVTLQTAMQAYWSIVGAAPATEDDLVAQGVIQAPSQMWDIAPDGTIMPQDPACV